MAKKILYITNGISGAAGLERVLSIKTSYFADQLGYEIHILTLNDDCKSPFYKFNDKIIFHTIDCKGNPFSYFGKYVLGLRKFIKQINPDLITVCDDGLKGLFVPFWIGKKRCPIIYERHVSKQIEFLEKNRFLGYKIKSSIMDFAGNFYDRFIVLTSDNINEWHNVKKLQVISNPLSFYPDKTTDFKKKRIIAVGRLSYQKGYERLLQAWQILQLEFPEWEINIYGKENDEGELRRQIKEAALQDRFKIYPPVNNIEDQYLNSSIFALPSRFEGFGMVLTEAMACGLPCVSFNCPCGPKDIIQDRVDGFLVNNNDIIDFANRLRQLMMDADLRIQMGREGRLNVRRYFIENIGIEWHSLFKELITSFDNK